MKVYFAKELEPQTGRTHPYQSSEWSRYYDFKKNPELIPEVLEDFKPWAQHRAVQVFYDLLLWLNGDSSHLESNDCAFRGPDANTDAKFRKKLRCTGRLIIFYRTIPLNLRPSNTAILRNAIKHYLEQIDPDFEWGVVGISSMPTEFLEVPTESQVKGNGVMLTFWAWGDEEKEVMENLARLFLALSDGLKLVSRDIEEAG